MASTTTVMASTTMTRTSTPTRTSVLLSVTSAVLYGCDFDAKTHYRCSAIGKPPTFVLVDARICGGTNEPSSDCTCSGTGDDSVCGHDLPASCAASPNTIYICRGGKSSKPEPLSERRQKHLRAR
ncbi:hypothetical protein BGX30_010808 [Mortierella sp. GBA39]|nr:hypothetical protein BGX30_010808 [Mortierella sp. GBA39]